MDILLPINILPWQSYSLFCQQFFEQVSILLVQLTFFGLAYAVLHGLLLNQERNVETPPTATKNTMDSQSTHQMT
jgi:hypothetical protein